MIETLSGPKPICDIIIPVWNQPGATLDCLRHISDNTCYPYRLIIVDNGSDTETKQLLEEYANSGKVMLIRNEKNTGFIKAVNQGMRESFSPYLCILNNDTMPGVKWLSELVEFADSNQDVGLLNPLCNGHIHRNMSINQYAREVSMNKNKYMEMNQCQGFCMLSRRSVVDKVGYLDERFGIGGFDDTDYSMRVHKAGYRSVCVHSSYVYHKEHQSFDALGERKRLQAGSEKAYFNKWPRHLRILCILSVGKTMGDAPIINFLNTSLHLAREWCWVNLLIYGDEKTRERVEAIKRKIGFPLHQNMKFNYLKNFLKVIDVSVRLLERSFGSKRRKKYDAVVNGDSGMSSFVNILCRLQKSAFMGLNFTQDQKTAADKIVKKFRENS